MSTESAVSNLIDLIVRNLDKGKISVSAFLDLAKAFDCIDRNILLKKLEYDGARGHTLMFLKSYFSDHLQYTNISDSNSNVLSVKYGIVQGSTLDSLMFLVYIIDIAESSRLLRFTYYAGNTVYMFRDFDLNILINTLRKSLNL